MKAVLWPSSVHPTSFQFADLMHLHITLRVKYFFFFVSLFYERGVGGSRKKLLQKSWVQGILFFYGKYLGLGGFFIDLFF